MTLGPSKDVAVSTAQAKLQHDTDLAGDPPPTSLVGEKEFSVCDFVVVVVVFGRFCFVLLLFLLLVFFCVCVFVCVCVFFWGWGGAGVFFFVVVVAVVFGSFCCSCCFFFFFFSSSFSYFVEYVRGPLPQIETRDEGTVTEGRKRRHWGGGELLLPSTQSVSQSINQCCCFFMSVDSKVIIIRQLDPNT